MKLGSSVKKVIFCCIFILCSIPLGSFQNIDDPYKILGINRRATLQDIRKAYKQLAKEWHPDKNMDSNAETKFVEIKQAYELLSDTERRKAYDLHGITSEDSTMYKQRHDYSQYARFRNDPFEEFFGGRFHYQEHDNTLFYKLSVTTKHFENKLMEKSAKEVVLVLFYSDWCMECLRMAPAWRRLVETLQPRGVTLATVHAGHEPLLTRQIGLSGLPGLIALINHKVYIYKDTTLSIQKVVEFIRSKMPYKLVRSITDDNVDDFLNGWEDNKVRGLIFEDKPLTRLRYLLASYFFRDRVSFGFVDVSSSNTEKIQKRYSIQDGLDTVMLFREEWQRPAATISMSDIPTSTLHQIIADNQLLTLPRLSSQSFLESVCPAEWQGGRRHLCAVLVTRQGSEHAAARESLRSYATTVPLPKDRIKFAYLYMDAQMQFVEALASSAGKISKDPNWAELRIVIIWRRDEQKIRHEWLADKWPSEQNIGVPGKEEGSNAIGGEGSSINRTQRQLADTLRRLLKPSEFLSYETVVKELVDEHTAGLWGRIVEGLAMMIDYIADCMQKETLLPVLSIFATILLILAAGYLMAHLVRLEEESIQRRKAEKLSNGNVKSTETSQNNNNGSPNISKPSALTQQSELKIHELRAEKYNGLVRLLKPGCRTIVLLADSQSRVQLLSIFHKTVWPYRKNKTLQFAHLDVDRHLSWYRYILQLSLPEPRELVINPRNCVGTVLALNGHRKYFCMFHVKHPESTKGIKRMARMTRRLGNKEKADPEVGAFMGFHSSEESSDSESTSSLPILQGSLLDGLDNWLDRLFEGTTHRYYINYWPDFTTK